MFNLKALMIGAALLPTVIGFTGVMAQTPPPPFDRSKDFGLTEVVPGIFLNADQRATLIERGCLIGPNALVARILERVGNTCDKQMFGKLAGVHKSGSSLWMLTVTPDGLELVRSVKGVNVSQNSLEMLVYPYKVYDHPYAGKPVRAAQAFNANGGAIKGQAVAGVLMGMANGMGSAGIAAATVCRNCGGTWNIQGGQGGAAVAEAGAISQQSSVNHLQANASVAGACPTGNCKK
jgi:hypothetical protein